MQWGSNRKVERNIKTICAIPPKDLQCKNKQANKKIILEKYIELNNKYQIIFMKHLVVQR